MCNNSKTCFKTYFLCIYLSSKRLTSVFCAFFISLIIFNTEKNCEITHKIPIFTFGKIESLKKFKINLIRHLF